MNEALQLWKEWFAYSGDPWEPDRDNWTSYCSFCGEEKPNHEPDCTYVKAKKLVGEHTDGNVIDSSEPIHDWFELSYAQYLTVPRLVMQRMPKEWQKKMAELLQEMDDTFDWRPKSGRYWVQLRDSHGHYAEAPLSDYRHGNIEHLRINREHYLKEPRVITLRDENYISDTDMIYWKTKEPTMAGDLKGITVKRLRKLFPDVDHVEGQTMLA